ncbi:MAG TPA: histidinol-phosphatase HisJ family protein [Clostridia bacterium]|nr:histidinol-phosphatase HisJ family protein [Clostridia bacterium]
MYKKILDMHTHTDNSFDGNHSTMFMCESAVQKGLRAVAFTDHVEIDYYKKNDFDRTAAQSYFEIVKARSAFRGKLIVCAGIEIGQPTYDIKTAEEVIALRNYDIVVGAIHNLRNMLDFWFLKYEEYSIEEINDLIENYFDELLLLVKWNKFDTLAHLTYPLRYICGENNIPIDISRFSQKIDAILEELAKNEKALEINTSGLRQKLNETMPNEKIVNRFKQLGGKYITIGSDAHYAEHLGEGIVEGMKIAKRCGFDSVTLYQKREPIQIPIE